MIDKLNELKEYEIQEMELYVEDNDTYETMRIVVVNEEDWNWAMKNLEWYHKTLNEQMKRKFEE